MYSSACYGVVGALVLDFVSSAPLQVYDTKRKDQRSLFVFHFQVNGLVILLGTMVNVDDDFYLVLKGRFITFYWGWSLKFF